MHALMHFYYVSYVNYKLFAVSRWRCVYYFIWRTGQSQVGYRYSSYSISISTCF